MGDIRLTQTFLEKIQGATLASQLKFDMNVGDTVRFFDDSQELGPNRSIENKVIREGKVVSKYDHIIHVEYYVGKPGEQSKLYRSFSKGQYACGTIRRVK